jgi:hypothetical protein
MTLTTTFVTVLRRFEYLAEKVMYSDHYNKLIFLKILKPVLLKFCADLLEIRIDKKNQMSK